MTDARADELDLVRRRVINVVGHELRTPLTTIRGLADLLPSAEEDELRDELIPALIRNAVRAEQLLDDLLLASEVTTARPIDAATDVDLDQAIASVADANGIPVEGERGVVVSARAAAIERALEHLVENAVVHGDGPSTILIGATDDEVTVTIRTPVDRPIPNLNLAFELFFRGEEAVTRAAGLGIGLPVARALARLDGGDVTIDQVDGVVSSRLRLPRAR